MENAAYYFAETVFIGESTAGESRHVLNGIVLAGEGNIMYNIYTHIYICISLYLHIGPLMVSSFPVKAFWIFAIIPPSRNCTLCPLQEAKVVLEVADAKKADVPIHEMQITQATVRQCL